MIRVSDIVACKWPNDSGWVKHVKLIVFMLAAICCLPATAQTYRLVQVTAVKAGGLYVFEQEGYVMSNKVSSNKLQTVNTYQTSGLTGTESYVWKLEKGKTDSYKMRNQSLSSNPYLCYTGSSTNLKFGESSKATSWFFTFQEDETVFIQVNDTEKRYLGFSDATNHEYKAYSPSINYNDNQFSHAIHVFELVEDGGIVSSVEKPVFSIDGGVVAYGTTVTLEQPDAMQILYTTDGSVPAVNSGNTTVYDGPIAITRDMTIKAIVVNDEGTASQVAEATFTVQRPSAPVFSPASGLVEQGTEVTLTGQGVKILYTLDGSNPSQSVDGCLEYVQPIVVNQDLTIKAIVVDEHGFESAVATATYTVNINSAVIDMRGHTESLVFSDFSKAGSNSTLYVQGPFPASDGKTYAGWTKDRCYYDGDDHKLLHMIGGEGKLTSPQILSDNGITVKVIYGSVSPLELSMGEDSETGNTGGDKHNQTSTVQLTTASTITKFTIQAGVKVAYVKSIEIIPLDSSNVPTSIRPPLLRKEEPSAYNLSGQRVDSSYKGLVIVNGKVVIRR